MSAELLAHVPGCADGAPALAIECLGRGTAHRSVLVRTRAGEFVVQSGRFAPESVAARRASVVLQNAAAVAGLAPEVIWSDAHTRITRYAAGRLWTRQEMGDPRQLERLGEHLRILHAVPPPKLQPFDPAATAESYRAALRVTDALEGRQLDSRVDEIRRILPRIEAGRPVCIVHGDLHHANVVEGARLVLIDWEYAAVADPLFDLGCLLAYYPQARPHAARLLDAAGLSDAASVGMLVQACELYEHLSTLWTAAVAAASPYGAGAAESAD